ncbi:hypothetical protein AURANDRAFT_62373 [Aureococcus anophagefferens]|uniref:Sulfotransferase domain-containing protein n=1 Tax=Aureococcus anophagefferens TaxID=44056 RepID=F0Y1M2_AURAN|nr:hypothetical protein AURANDRAFT_62373 [Aureococcus anophagefferens]EGB10847.1 hypothetical protein AURANDRAFT_62373 [Aureococcus anophagefferens]|eukprot:XP_009034426.1 hypothetical protein AURANDRAFT_62373 [Aureococcus anophagefferens]
MQRSAPQRSSPRFRDPEDPRRRPPKRDRDLTCAAVILVLGLNASLALVLGALRRESVLDLSRQANLAWRDRALAAEGAVDALAARLARDAAPGAAAAPAAPAARGAAAGAGRRSVDLWERAEAAAAPPKPAKEPALPPFYGAGARTFGAETCAAFRGSRPPHLYRWSPAGMFNCGTNTLLNLMHLNCNFDATGRHTLWQAPWGKHLCKHNPHSWRGRHWAPQFGEGAWRPDPDSIFPVVVTKDPATWMKSMCRNQYESRFKHARSRRPRGARVFRPTSTRASSNGFDAARHHDPETCPSPVADTRVTMRYQPDKPSYYDNLPDFWVRWHDERLVVRFEDLLFDSEKTISTVCACVGGKMRPRFTQEEIVSKDKTLGHYGPVNDRAKALRLYSSEKHRFDHYDRDDLELLKAVAGRSHLFKAMGYDFDVDAALETQRRRRLLFGNATRGRRRR